MTHSDSPPPPSAAPPRPPHDREALVRASRQRYWIGRSFSLTESTGSTNDDIRAMWQSLDDPGAIEDTHRTADLGDSTAHGHDGTLSNYNQPSLSGHVALTEWQDAGRGRLGRRWTAPPRSSVLMSFGIPARDPRARPPILVAWASLAIAEAVEQMTGLPARVKWPNDVRVEGRKLSGVLIEITQRVAVVGIGINVLSEASDFPPELDQPVTSLKLLGHPHSITDVANTVLDRLDRLGMAMARRGFGPVSSAWSQRWELANRSELIRVFMRRGACAGYALSLKPDLGLLLREPGSEAVRLISIDDLVAIQLDSEST